MVPLLLALVQDTYAPDPEGFIRNWLVLAPIPCEAESNGAVEIDAQQVPGEAALAPRAGDVARGLTWTAHATSGYFIDFLRSFGETRGENVIGYAAAYVHAEAEMDVEMRVGSNDQCKVYVNGAQVLRCDEGRSLEKDQNSVKVTLRKGVNRVLLKVINESNQWQGCLRFMAKGLKVALAPPQEVEEVVALGQPVEKINPVRVALNPKTDRLLVLYLNGDLWEVDVEAKTKRLHRKADDYMRKGRAPYLQALGLHVDVQGRVYVVANERKQDVKPWAARVVVYRDAEEYLTFEHPWGIGPFNHGACHLAEGPDGKMYLGVGSRTDHGEAGKDEHLDKNGETEWTAAVLRFDREAPKPEVYCRGLRNPYGFAWDDRGRLIAGEHGPDANHPEELNWLREGKHYGFPYVFGDGETPMYKDAVPAPAGLSFEAPIANLGPDARPGDQPYYSFHPHSAPTGMVFYKDGALPERYKGSFFVTRFGNFLGKEPVGFEVLNVRLEEKDGRLAARCESFYKTSRRPIDLCLRKGRLYILEYDTVDSARPSRLLVAK